MTLVIGTAGHIDHGKTTLLRALTGTDTDRLPEEQRRGLTIEIGYAHFSPDGGPEIDFVDVPGHDKLVGNMLVGVGEIDAAMLVVAADDGPREQTWEHLGLLDAMGISDGLVVVTKTDLVDAQRVATVTAQLRPRLEATMLADAQPFAVSATTGAGLAELRSALALLRDDAGPSASVDDRPEVRLAIDRVFSVRGRGVVVTGTSRGRAIRGGDRVRALPGGLELRVRGLQTHDAAVDEGPHGGRVALNVAGAGAESLRRGQVLVSGELPGEPLTVKPSDRMLVLLQRPAELPGRRDSERWPPADGFKTRLHIGTDQVDVALGRAGRDDVVLDDGRALAMLRLGRPVAAAVGMRFVLRRPPPARLLAAGIVLDPWPARGRSRHRQTPERVAQLAVAVSTGQRVAIVEALLEMRGVLVLPDGPRLAADVGDDVASVAVEAVAVHHRDHPEQAGMPLSLLRATSAQVVGRHVSIQREEAGSVAADAVDALLSKGRFVRQGDSVRAPDHEVTERDLELDAAMDRLEALLDTAAPPALQAAAAEAGCAPEGVRELERAGRIVSVDDNLAWAASAYAELGSQALTLARVAPVTPATLRDATGTSRKYVMALLEDLDRRGILRRTPAGHIPGPRA